MTCYNLILCAGRNARPCDSVWLMPPSRRRRRRTAFVCEHQETTKSAADNRQPFLLNEYVTYNKNVTRPPSAFSAQALCLLHSIASSFVRPFPLPPSHMATEIEGGQPSHPAQLAGQCVHHSTVQRRRGAVVVPRSCNAGQRTGQYIKG